MTTMTLTPGRYLARALPMSMQFGRSAQGNEQVAVELEILDADERPCGDSITWTGAFASPDSQEIALNGLEAMGWKGDTVLDPDGLGDVVCEIGIVEEEYKGEKNLRVKWVGTPGAARFRFKQSLDDGSKAALASKMAGLVAMRRQRGGGAQGGGGKTGTDDIPF